MTNKAPLISVVIPSYNSGNYIGKTLESLANQTSKNSFEVIIIDDQSSDNTFLQTQEIVRSLNLTAKVEVRPNSIPKGVSSCRNLGIKLAGGMWISFLDSDDIFYPEKIEETGKLIAKYGDECAAFIHGDRKFEDETNITLSVSNRNTFEKPTDLLPALINKNIITTSTVTLKKSLIEEIGYFDTTLHGIEDYMMWLRISKRTPWYYSENIWTDYRVRKESLMGGRPMKYYVIQNAGLLGLVNSLPEFTQAEFKAIEKYLFFDVMEYYAAESLRRRGLSDFMQGLKELCKLQRYSSAQFLAVKHSKFFILRKLSGLKRALKSQKPV